MRKLIKTVALTAGMVAAVATANAQSDWKKEIAGTMQVQGMYRPAKLGQLNTVLNANGIPALPDNDYWLNLSMNHMVKRWIMEDGIGASFMSNSAPNTTNGIKAKYNQYQIFGRVGYNVATTSKMRAFPFAGFNLSAARLRIKDDVNTHSTADFSQQLLNSTASKTLWNPRFGLEFGAGFDYLIGLKDKTIDNYTVHRSLPIGVRFGYYLQTSNSQWRFDDNYKLNNGPTEKQSGVFVNVNIGLGFKVQRP